jgi:hypothetical protein
MSTLEVNKITPQGVATEVTLGDSGDTFTIPSGVTLDGSSATLTGFATTNGITEADTWMVTGTFQNVSNGVDEVKTSNWARQVAPTYGSFSKIGTGMSESSGIFTFPSTGIYHVTWNSYFDLSSATSAASIKIQVSDNGGSNYVTQAISGCGSDPNRGQTVNAQTFVDVTSTSNVKVRFLTNGGTYINWFGDPNATYTYATFVRLGDT